MKWLRTMILFDNGNLVNSTGWGAVHESYVSAIKSIEHPEGSGSFTIRTKAQRPGSKQFDRNGVGYLKRNFLRNMVEIERWQPEFSAGLSSDRRQPKIKLYPSGETYQEPVTSEFGGFDFLTTSSDGLKIAIEWETGNISSSHRSMNKLAIALKTGIIDAGVLILPSRSLYHHLTDRIGNISELSGYLELWEGLKDTVAKGLLAVTVVEHDFLSVDTNIPYLPTANDGRAKQGRERG